jgi:hypothetical protein
MKLKTLALAVALAFPLATMAADDKAKSGSTDKSMTTPSKSATTSTDKKAASGATAAKKEDGGAEAMFKAMDKNKDGSISKDEAQGTPHSKDFATLDKNRDGKLSRQEHASAPEHAGKKDSAATGSTAAPAKKETTK